MAGENELGAEGAEDVGDVGVEPGAEVEEGGGDDAQPGADARPREKDGKFKAPTAAEKRRYKFKAAGQDIEADLSDEEVAQELSLSRGAQKKLWEAAQQRKQVEAERETLKKERERDEATRKALAGDPRKLRAWVREQTGGDAKKAHALFIAVMKEEIADLNQDPRERRLQELEQEKQEREAADEEAREKGEREKVTAETAQKVAQLREKFTKDLTGILAHVKLKPSERVLAVAAELYMENRTSGADLSPEQLAEEIREETVGFALDVTKEWTAEDWQTHDPATYKKIVKHAADGVRGRQAGASGGAPRREPPALSRKDEATAPNGGYPFGVIPPKKPLSREEEKKIYNR